MGRALSLVALMLASACSTTPSPSAADERFDSWRVERGRVYARWRGGLDPAERWKVDSLLADLTRFYYYPPPGAALHRMMIAGQRERYLEIAADLGVRMRALGDDLPKVALAVFDQPAPDPPADEPYHEYRQGPPNIMRYLRLLWHEAVITEAMPARLIAEPLTRYLAPRLALSRFVAPSEPIREELKASLIGYMQDPAPFRVELDVAWEAGGRRPGRSEPLLIIAGGGGGGGTAQEVLAPQAGGDYEIRPITIVRVKDLSGRVRLEDPVALPPRVLTVTQDPDGRVERVRFDTRDVTASVRVRSMHGPRAADGSLWLSTEFSFSARLPRGSQIPPIFFKSRVILASGSSFDLKAEARDPTGFQPADPRFSLTTRGVAGGETREADDLLEIGATFACGQRVDAGNLPEGEDRARLELSALPSEARHSGYDRVADFGVLVSEPFDLRIEPRRW